VTTSPAQPDLRVASSDRSRRERPALPGSAEVRGETGPDGILHGYALTTSRTICGRPLVEMYLWPGLTWPRDVPAGSACYSCELVVQHQT